MKQHISDTKSVAILTLQITLKYPAVQTMEEATAHLIV